MGHSGTQSWQSMQVSGSITSIFGLSISQKQSTGQTVQQSVYLQSTQRPVTMCGMSNLRFLSLSPAWPRRAGNAGDLESRIVRARRAGVECSVQYELGQAWC